MICLFWVALHSMAHSSIELYKAVVHVTLKDELPRSVGAQYSTGDQWRNNSRNNEEMEPKQTHIIKSILNVNLYRNVIKWSK